MTNIDTKQVKDAKKGIVWIRVTVANLGGSQAVKSLTEFRIDGKLLGTVETGKLGKGNWIVVKKKWDARQVTGQHVISIVVDYTKNVKESDETNNWARLNVTVRNKIVTNGQFTGP